MNYLATLATSRADRNDAREMGIFEDMRLMGLSPARRVEIAMEGYEVTPLGPADWNKRQDTISAAPDEMAS